MMRVGGRRSRRSLGNHRGPVCLIQNRLIQSRLAGGSRRSLRNHLTHALAAPLLFAAIAATVLSQAPAQPATVESSPATSTAARLLHAHHCWTGPAPRGVDIPSHVIYTQDGGRPVYGGRAATRVALQHVFGNERRGMVVYGFCR